MCATAAPAMALQTDVESEILGLCARILRETDARLDAKRGTSDQSGSPGAECPSRHSLPRSGIPWLIGRDCLATIRERLLFYCLPGKKAGWGSPLPVGHGRGISVQFAFGSYL